MKNLLLFAVIFFLSVPATAQTNIEQKLIQTGVQEVNAWLIESKKSDAFELNEQSLNAFGYRLLYNLNKPQEAIKIFELVIQFFPESSNAFDSAAEGYLITEDFEKSIEYYRKAIELNGRAQFHQLGYLKPDIYQPTLLPPDTVSLFRKVGNWENEIAFVYMQGGPDLQLNISSRDGLHLMPNHEDLLKIYPYQAQMLNPKSLVSDPILTEKQSDYENAKSVEILDRVIKYLVAHKKKVFLIGHSYGASISMEYVHSKKNLAEKVVLMGLDLDEDISSWETLKSGEYIRWENGKNPFARIIFGWISSIHPLKSSFDRVADNLTMIVKSNMAKKYTNLLEEEDFKKIISVYSTQDEANGKKSAEETSILKQKGTIVIEIQGNHHAMLTTEFMTVLYEHLMNIKSLED
ncbi:MAG: hypothetical protein RIE52_08280 [Balneola sp.]